MIDRRGLILGGACLIAAAGAYQLKPRRSLNLLGKNKMAAVVPTSFGSWTSHSEDGLVKPETEGKLAALLYSELVSRVYRNETTGEEVMMLVAYGDTQSDLLQLHRPESCYPAVGFRLAMNREAMVPVSKSAAIPSRRVLAERSDRRESIVYWTRLGEYLPASAGEQRKMRLLTSMQGYVADGALFRFSSVDPPESAFTTVERFIGGLVLAVAADRRPALIGSELARRI